MLQFDRNEFTYNPKTKTLSAEASDLGLSYSPANIAIVGKNETRRFSMSRIVKDREGEILWHEYRGTDNITLQIFND